MYWNIQVFGTWHYVIWWHFKICQESLAQRHSVICMKTWLNRNTAVQTTILTLCLQCYKCYIKVPWCPSCYNKVQWNKLFDKRTMWNCLSTILYWISHTITLLHLTNYLDLISAGVSHNCGGRTSSGIVNVGVNIRVTKLSYNTHHAQYWLTENQFHQHFRTFRFCDKNCISLLLWVQLGQDSTTQEFLIVKCLARQTWMVMESCKFSGWPPNM
jgi:hypothetical protein